MVSLRHTRYVHPERDPSRRMLVPATRLRVVQVLTGGQTGADRAATDFAVASGIAYGGWVPSGGWAEDSPTPPGVLAAYPNFTATASEDPAVRTIRNVDDADGLLVVSIGEFTSRGTELALARAAQRHTPLVSIDVRHRDAGRLLETFVTTLGVGCRLNVAGPRESEQPGVYGAVRRFLDAHADLLRGVR